VPSSRTIFSAAEDYVGAAATELRSAFPGAEIAHRGPDVGSIEATGLDLGAVTEACRRRRVVFVRHLFREIARVPFADEAGDLARIVEAALGALGEAEAPPEVALQVWSSGVSPATYRTEQVWWRLAEALAAKGIAAARGARSETVSICLTPAGILLGRNPSRFALSDWGGGRVRLARDTDRVSRSEFKLEELFFVAPPPLPVGGVALDLGASPGGWTRVLRRRGLTVWAVDPGALHPRVATDPGVRHVRTTAARFLARPGPRFDVVVNDMRMTPALSCRVMEQAARRLVPGGLAIVTLKLSPENALLAVRESLVSLERDYEIVFARQLYHNRNEITVVARRQPREATGRARPGPPRW
jgi:23S rRNA (cytidine2498-2'-O)-methyltransferase